MHIKLIIILFFHQLHIPCVSVAVSYPIRCTHSCVCWWKAIKYHYLSLKRWQNPIWIHKSLMKFLIESKLFNSATRIMGAQHESYLTNTIRSYGIRLKSERTYRAILFKSPKNRMKFISMNFISSLLSSIHWNSIQDFFVAPSDLRKRWKNYKNFLITCRFWSKIVLKKSSSRITRLIECLTFNCFCIRLSFQISNFWLLNEIVLSARFKRFKCDIFEMFKIHSIVEYVYQNVCAELHCTASL